MSELKLRPPKEPCTDKLRLGVICGMTFYLRCVR